MKESLRDALGVETGDHPTYEMIEQFVDGAADGVTREIVESHAEVCPRCEAEIRDLVEFAHRRSPFASPRWIIAAAAVVAIVVVSAFLMTRRDRNIGHVGVVRASGAPPDQGAPEVHTTPPSGYGHTEWDIAVRDALSSGNVNPPSILRELRPPAQVLRGPGDTLRGSMNPAGVVIETTTPEFTWSTKQGRYVVSVFDGLERVARSSELRSPRWRMPAPLARGRTYTWQVEIRRGGSREILPAPPAPPAFFRVLDERDAAMLAEARNRFPDDHLLLGVLYARFGMQQPAVEELRTHAVQHPNAAALADAVARW